MIDINDIKNILKEKALWGGKQLLFAGVVIGSVYTLDAKINTIPVNREAMLNDKHSFTEKSVIDYKLSMIKDKDKIVKRYDELSSFAKKEVDIIVEALYYEAGGELVEGQIGVAYTILNRKKSDNFPNTFNSVINCEYSYKCDGIPEKNIKNTLVYNQLLEIALYTYQDKLDYLQTVPVKKQRGKYIYVGNYNVDRDVTFKLRNAFFYATHASYETNDFFKTYSKKGYRKDEAIKYNVGGHRFLVAKPNTRLASLL